ncbi:MAG: hypothetical protein MR328_02855 [Firmicutes bacterium]|nr:hypothetical protein [Bacillota bacterium]
MKNHRLWALMLSFVLAFTMCVGSLESAFAEEVDEEPADTPSVQLELVESDDSTSLCYEVVVPERGFLEISFPAGDEESETVYDTKLLNYEKQPLVGDDWQSVTAENDYTLSYGLAAGTYYLLVKGDALEELPSVDFMSVDDKIGSTKAKAVSIYKNGSEKTGVITAKQKKTSCQWYKFKVNKAQKVTIRIAGKTNGSGLKFTIMDKNGSSVVRTIDSDTPERSIRFFSIVNKKQQEKLAAGTYWIKVQKVDESGDGYYSIKWK